MKHSLGFYCALLLASMAGGDLAFAAPPAPIAAPLQAEAARLARTAGGPMGVAAWRLDGTGAHLLLNADQAFPMASTFKVAVAGRVMERVDKGELTLDRMIDVKPEMMVPSEVLADRFIHPGVSLSLYNLLELMLTQSDNTATDVLTAMAGGPAAVTDWVRRQGITGLRVDRDTNGLLHAFYSLPPGPLGTQFDAMTPEQQQRLVAQMWLPLPAFDHDPQDTTTPAAMATLLTRIFSGEAVSPASTKIIVDIMSRCRTGEHRLRDKLPPDTPVAHKTGSIGGSTNDVGVITLPDGEKVVIAAYVKESAAPVAARERAIAEVARAIYDYFLMTRTIK